METDKVINKRMNAAGIVLAAAIVTETAALWNEYAWYESMAKYTTLISFVFLIAAFLCAVPPKEAFRDPYFALAAAGCVTAFINIMIIDSGKGAFLTAADVLIVAYLAGKLRLGSPVIWFAYIYVGFFFFYWTFDVKGYFKGYNTNYGGLVLITGFVFAVTGLIAFYERLRKETPAGARFLLGAIVFMFAWGYNIIAWYRARCALLGLVVFALLLLVPAKIWGKRLFYTAVTLAMTAGAIVVSLVYVVLGKYIRDMDIQVFYKDIISGRDEIWADLWSAFLKMPVTGIGSSYRINVEWMGGMFEVHNGLLDILIVHGVIVFALTFVILVQRLLRLRERAQASIVARSALSAAFAILAASFMENFFIVPPFLLCTLALIAIAGSV